MHCGICEIGLLPNTISSHLVAPDVANFLRPHWDILGKYINYEMQLPVVTICTDVGHQHRDWDMFHERFFLRNSNSTVISFRPHPSCGEVIAVKFCTWHDSSCHVQKSVAISCWVIELLQGKVSIKIWTVDKSLLVKQAPEHYLLQLHSIFKFQDNIFWPSIQIGGSGFFFMICEIGVFHVWKHEIGVKLTWNRDLQSLSWSRNPCFSHVNM